MLPVDEADIPYDEAGGRVYIHPLGQELLDAGVVIAPHQIHVAAKLEFTILAKRRIDIISDGVTTKLNRTGNAGMSVAGTGDVLAGEAVALLSKQVSPFNSARMAAFLNGTAGDLAFQRLGYSIMATDVIEQIPDVLHRSLRKLG
mgnify:CR=1 FL=1